MNALTDIGRLLATAATFLTRLPWVARWCYPDLEALGRATPCFPVIGVVVGLIAATTGLAVHALTGAVTVGAWAALIASVLCTGAFHEDGLADACDGLFGGYTVERKLEIMKDSRIGSFGAAALVLLFGTKAALLAALDPSYWLPALIAAHVWARASTLPLAFALPYVRDGNHKPVAAAVTPFRLTLGLGLALLLTLPTGPLLALAAGVLTLATAALLGRWLRGQIGGVTGDTLGAVNQVVEVLVLGLWLAAVHHGLA
ncbi:MAG: adenosylcobinamide-GDP ribazoletransferase [Xanthomonadales bacterium]|jgi:adenosylcobinamide-GDP ribazoletransferase|nr:adenosylcobinamide-GDP ribazoletransferase [Xanthomonadales bacterium]